MRFVRNKLRKNQQKYFDDIDDEQKSQICYINEKNETKLNRKSFLVNKKKSYEKVHANKSMDVSQI